MKRKDVEEVLIKLFDRDINIFKAADAIMKLSKNEDIVIEIPISDIDEIYKAYPSKCVVRGVHSGKGEKNKEQINRILQTKTKKDMLSIIERYVADCKRGKVYMKNFSTFLNNLPDFSEVEKKTTMHMDGRSRNIREITELQ